MPTSLQDLEVETGRLLGQLGAWSQDHLRFQPVGGGWSATQVVDHLVRTEAGILSATETGLAQPHRIGLRDRAGVWMLQRIFRSDRRVKVPSSAAATLPSEAPLLPECVERWAQERKRLAMILAAARSVPADRGLFRHPVGGWMTMQAILDFFAVHLHHHRFQIAALAQLVGEPG